jgi:hypothetical protein
MFLAPLNYDRFFKKVFSNLNIAKKFLEDFLEIEIDEIEFLPSKYKITDEATLVEFDFRCKSKGQYFIVDMQQWYKSDVVKRFFFYSSLNSALQLETLPKKDPIVIGAKTYDNKVYDALLPSITLIWMSDDSLKFEEDYVAYSIFPEQAIDFIKNDAFWATETKENLDIERKKILTLLNNKTKGLDFLSQNRLIFAFQKNIVKNQKLKKYVRWFIFAEKTRNKDNEEADFDAFKNDETFMAVMERIQVTKLNQEERTAWEDADLVKAQLAFWKRDAEKEMQEQKKEMQEQKKEMQEKLQEQLQEKLQEEKKEFQAREEANNVKIVISAFQKGLGIDLIADITSMPLEKVKAIIEVHTKAL